MHNLVHVIDNRRRPLRFNFMSIIDYCINDIQTASPEFHALLTDDTKLTSTLCSFDVNMNN